MDKFLKNKKIVIALVSAVVVVVLYFAFFANRGEETDFSQTGGGTLTEVPLNPEEELLGRGLLLSLEKMRSVKLDLSIFSDPVFSKLQDFSVEIKKQPVGRRNPFAPLLDQKED